MAVVFLIGFLALSLIGALVLWLRDRTPRSMEAHMRAFEKELHALSPDAPFPHEPSARRRPPAGGPAAGHEQAHRPRRGSTRPGPG